MYAKNIGRQYEAFRMGETEGIPDFELALKRHALIEEMYWRWDQGTQSQEFHA